MGEFNDCMRVQNPPCKIVRDVFIETGTQVGNSFEQAMAQPFRRLYTIEVNTDNHMAALRRFEHRLEFRCPCGCGFEQKASLHHGSSPELLPRIVDPERDTTLFLDAHFVSENVNEMDARYGQCPLLRELEIIATVPWKTKPLVVIDDSRMFDGSCKRDAIVNPNFKWDEWPDLNDIMRVVAHHRFNMGIFNEQIWLW